MYADECWPPLRKSRGPLYTHRPVGGETLTLNARRRFAPDLDTTSKSSVRLPVYRRNGFDEMMQLREQRPSNSHKKKSAL